MNGRSKVQWVMMGFLVALFAASALLAWTRIYQVDEAQNLYMAKVIASGGTKEFFTNAALWLIGPMTWLNRSFHDSASVFLAGRLVFLCVFWGNAVLLVHCTGERPGESRWLFLLILAMTLAPMWDYGFEIRHDNLILTGVLLMWWTGRVRPAGVRSYVTLGALAVLMLFVAFKAFVYVLPVSFLFLAFPHPGHHLRPLRRCLAWVGGALGMLAAGLAVYWATGLWPIYMAAWKGGFAGAVNASGFGIWFSLQRLLVQTPLLLALVAAPMIQLPQTLRREARTEPWAGWLPEAVLLLIAFGGLLVNPTPFPYNLVNVTPFAFLLAYGFAGPRVSGWTQAPGAMALGGGLLLFTWFVPFGQATWRHFAMTNDRQERLMSLAESMTDPMRDRVFDATGMVVSRKSIHFQWYLHSLNLASFSAARGTDIPSLLQARPASVIIPNYRTDWLRKVDWDFIKSRYLPLADDFWVLGTVIKQGGGDCKIHHPGRYLLLGLEDGRIGPLSKGEVDGRPIGPKPIWLETGSHMVNSGSSVQAIILWVGPNLDSIPKLDSGNHQLLFQNWY